jgi:hypothetical protein
MTHYYANGASVVEYEYGGKIRYRPQVNGRPVTSRSFVKLSAARKAAGAAARRMARDNPGRNPSKRKKKKSAVKRVSVALTRWLKQQNPAFKKATGVRVKRLKGGVIKLIPEKM